MHSWLDIVPVGTAALTAEFGATPVTEPAAPSLAEAAA
jgi:hypothetical protein